MFLWLFYLYKNPIFKRMKHWKSVDKHKKEMVMFQQKIFQKLGLLKGLI